jgi:hypothetical protein
MTDFETFLADLRHPDEDLNVPDLNQIMVAGRRLRRRRNLIAFGGAVAAIAVTLTISIGILADRGRNATQPEQPGSSIGSVVDPSPSPGSSPSPSPSSSPSTSYSSSPSISSSAGESAWPDWPSSSAPPPDPSKSGG